MSRKPQSAAAILGESPSSSAEQRRILRRPEVEQRTGFKRAHLYALMKEKKFPKPIKLGIRAVGWDSLEVERWIALRLADRW